MVVLVTNSPSGIPTHAEPLTDDPLPRRKLRGFPMIDIWRNHANQKEHLSHNPLTIGCFARAGARRLQRAEALAVGPFGAPDAAPLVVVLEPGELDGVHGSARSPSEFAVG